jgi:hypothetical protein
VGLGDDADQPAVLAHRKAADLVVRQQLQRLVQNLLVHHLIPEGRRGKRTG